MLEAGGGVCGSQERTRSLERQKIVAVGPESGLMEHLEELFSRAPVEVHRVNNPRHALDLLEAFDIDLMLVEHPLEEHTMREFVVDAAEKSSGRLKILVLASEETHAELIAAVGDRYPVVGSADPTVLRSQVARHLLDWPARPKRLMVTMQVQMGGPGLLRMAQTENLSESGVLIRTREKIPVGSEIDLELSLPGAVGPMKAVGEVMRYQKVEGGEALGLGVACTRLTGEAADRLNDYLDQCMAPSS